MKRIIMMVAAALVLAAPATMAQKIKVESYQSKLEKSDKAIQNPKKAAKASTWITRGNDYLSALQAPTSGIFVAMEVPMLKITIGEPRSTYSKEIAGRTYDVLDYNFFDVYAANNKVVGWKMKKEITKDATSVVIEAYNKALELDKRQADKVHAGFERLANYYAQAGDIANALSDYVSGAKAYTMVYDLQATEGYRVEPNPIMLYYAGYMYTIAANEDPSLCPEGVIALNRAVEAGYPEQELADTEVEDSEKGNIFYYLYHCYYGQKDNNPEVLQEAKAALLKGVEMFPKNQRIIDALTQLYTTEEGMGDPIELIDMIDSVIAEDPTNADIWYARGRVYFSLKDYDNCIASFEKVTELAPEVFDGHFYLGLFYIYKGDALSDEISNKLYTENAEYDKDIQETVEVYAAAIPILERAHELKPEDVSTVEYLKSLCFRLRDEEGIMDKYKQYDELFQTMKAAQAE